MADEIKVKHVMQPNPVCLRPEESVHDAIVRMNELRIGAVLVADEGKLVGIFTERDFLRNTALAQPGWRVFPVSKWMTGDPHVIGPDIGWEEAAVLMERVRVRHLPVVEDGHAVGIISSRHLIAHRAKYMDQLFENRTGELRRANDQLLARDSEMTHYMKVAAKLQKKLVLPDAPPNFREVAWGFYFAPLDPLGGDYYDFVTPDADHLGFLIADASGHSIPAAMVAMMTRQAFAEVSKTRSQPAEVLAALNARLSDIVDDRFVTAFYGIFDRRSRRFTYANAGHPFPYRYSPRTKECQPLSARGYMLGISIDEMYVEKGIDLEPGDRLCFYTDGITDCRDDQGETFGTDRVIEYLRAQGELPAADLATAFQRRLKEFRGGQPATDDMTLVVAEVR